MLKQQHEEYSLKSQNGKKGRNSTWERNRSQKLEDDVFEPCLTDALNINMITQPRFSYSHIGLKRQNSMLPTKTCFKCRHNQVKRNGKCLLYNNCLNYWNGHIHIKVDFRKQIPDLYCGNNRTILLILYNSKCFCLW